MQATQSLRPSPLSKGSQLWEIIDMTFLESMILKESNSMLMLMAHGVETFDTQDREAAVNPIFYDVNVQTNSYFRDSREN